MKVLRVNRILGVSVTVVVKAYNHGVFRLVHGAKAIIMGSP